MGISKVLLVGAILSLTSIAFADDTPVEIVSITGFSVMVSPAEIKRACLALSRRKSKNAEKIVTNEDGSVAITRLYFIYKEKALRIDWTAASAKGVCKRFGFGTYVGSEYQTVAADATVVGLNEDGKLAELLPPNPNFQRSILETVACQ